MRSPASSRKLRVCLASKVPVVVEPPQYPLNARTARHRLARPGAVAEGGRRT